MLRVQQPVHLPRGIDAAAGACDFEVGVAQRGMHIKMPRGDGGQHFGAFFSHRDAVKFVGVNVWQHLEVHLGVRPDDFSSGGGVFAGCGYRPAHCRGELDQG